MERTSPPPRRFPAKKYNNCEDVCFIVWQHHLLKLIKKFKYILCTVTQVLNIPKKSLEIVYFPTDAAMYEGHRASCRKLKCGCFSRWLSLKTHILCYLHVAWHGRQLFTPDKVLVDCVVNLLQLFPDRRSPLVADVCSDLTENRLSIPNRLTRTLAQVFYSPFYSHLNINHWLVQYQVRGSIIQNKLYLKKIFLESGLVELLRFTTCLCIVTIVLQLCLHGTEGL